MPPDIGEYLVRFLDKRPGVSPDLTLRTIRPGDRYLLCSDGLSGVISADAIQDVLARVDDLDEVVTTLVRLAHEAGAPDNVTVIAVDLPDGAWQPGTSGPRVLGAAATAVAAS
jgi:protein phosphatase